ncbi:MAG: hypothetical protein H0V69_14210 [Acidimicrobiia bacterium]|nr:hypothetical protein [Acidimicrobiia bacterium]
MILWHVSVAVAAVWFVFRDPRFDYRWLAVGSVLPMLDAVTGGKWIMHTLAFSVVLVTAVMLATVGRRPLRRMLLGVPIGALLYLVFSGAWNDGETLWWPAMGWQLGERPIPLVERGWVLTLVLEAVGAFLGIWGWRRARLGDPRHRRRLLQRGQLDFMVD